MGCAASTPSSPTLNPWAAVPGNNGILLDLVKRGDISIVDVQELVRGGGDVNASDGYGHTPLYYACRDGNANCVQVLLRGGAAVDALSNYGDTPLAIACQQLGVMGGAAECVRMLLDYGANVNLGSSPTPDWQQSRSAVGWAAMNRNADFVKELLDRGAIVSDSDLASASVNLSVQDYRCWRLLGGDPDEYMRLATWGKPDFELATFLNISVLNPHTDTRNSLLTRVHAFLVAGADEDDRCIGFLPPGRGGTKPPSSLALHEAAGSGNTSLVRDLIKGGADIHMKDERGVTPLYMAAMRGHCDCVRELLNEGAAVGAVDLDGVTPLHGAAWAGHAECVWVLLHKGSMVDTENKDAANNDGHTPLHMAARNGHAECVETLQTQRPSEAVADDGNSPLHIAAASPPEPHDYAPVLSGLDYPGFSSWDGPIGLVSSGSTHTSSRSNKEQEQVMAALAGAGSFPLADGLVADSVDAAAGARSGGTSSGGTHTSWQSNKHEQFRDVLSGVRYVEWKDITLREKLGGGSFGQVFAAEWNKGPVAVKRLDDLLRTEPAETKQKLLDDLLAEAGIMAALRHPNIVMFMGICTSPPSIITELCAKGSLYDVLQEAKRDPASLPWSQRLHMAIGAAQGLHQLHCHTPPIIHRDLKSLNVLVDKDGNAKVADFNLSKVAQEAIRTGSAGNTMSNMNPVWLAPEVIQGGRSTVASDIFALGVVLWELMVWESPWRGYNVFRIQSMVVAGQRLEVPAADALPGDEFRDLPAYTALMRRCWAQEPGDRPKDCGVVLDALRRLRC